MVLVKSLAVKYLNRFQMGQLFLVETGEEDVAIIQMRGHKCMDYHFKLVLRHHGSVLCDVIQLKKGVLNKLLRMVF